MLVLYTRNSVGKAVPAVAASAYDKLLKSAISIPYLYEISTRPPAPAPPQ